MVAITNATRLGAAVRSARRAAGLTQVELAGRSGVSRAWLARFEGGHPSASLEQVMLVLRVLHLGIELVEPELRPHDREILDAVRARREGHR